MDRFVAIADLCFLISLSALTSAGTPTKDVPENFIGQWATDVVSCGHSLSESTMRLASSSIAFYASGGPIVSVVVHSDDEMTIAAKIYGEDGHDQLQSLKLRLSLGGTRLERDDSEEIYYRCPDNAVLEWSNNSFKPTPLRGAA